MDIGVWSIIIGTVSSLIATFIGAGAGYYASSKATQTAFENSLKLQEQNQKDLIRGFLLGIQTEIQALLFMYQLEFGTSELETLEEGMPFLYYYPTSQNYFTVFENNAALVGQIPDDELRDLIIKIYLCARSVINTHIYNNALIEKRNDLLILQSHTKNSTLQKRIDAANHDLDEYGINIKTNYEMVVK